MTFAARESVNIQTYNYSCHSIKLSQLCLRTIIILNVNGPALVRAALTAACNSGNPLSWKVQESKQGTLIQLVWNTKPEHHSRREPTRVASNWKCQATSQPCNVKKRNCPSTCLHCVGMPGVCKPFWIVNGRYYQ